MSGSPDDSCSLLAACHQTLHLASLVPVNDFQLQALSLEEIFAGRSSVRGWDDWIIADLQLLRQTHFACSALRYRMMDVADLWSATDATSLTCLQIFTDGSATPGAPHGEVLPCSAWSFCVWADCPSGSYYLGHAAFPFTSPSSPFHCGETVPDALTAEQLAVCWALIWLIDIGHSYGVPAIVCYDCTSAGLGAFACATQPHQPLLHHTPTSHNCTLSELVTILRQTAQALMPVHHRHVAGHRGTLGNEVADCLARIASHDRSSEHERCLLTWPRLLAQHELRGWAWCALCPQPDLPRLFSFSAEASRLQLQQRAAVPPPSDGTTHFPPAQLSVHLSLLSYNVLSLHDTADKSGPPTAPLVGMRLMGKRDVLKRQLLDQGILFTGLQETRLAGTCIAPDRDFFILQSSAEPSGQLGVALWVNKNLAYAHSGGQPLHILREHLHVTDCSSRHILVQIQAPFLRLAVLVAHGPFEGSRHTTPSAFWTSMGTLLASPGLARDVVVLTDANARVGSVLTESIGGFGAEQETEVGDIFHSFLLKHGLCLPSTFEEAHSGQHATWVGVHGVPHRLDYVAIPQPWRTVATSRVVVGFESLQIRQDHWPVHVACVIQPRAPPSAFRGPPKRRAMRPNEHWTEIHAESYLESLRQSPALSWDLDVDEHFARLTSSMREAFDSSHCPVQPHVQQTYLTAETTQLILRRKALRQYLSQEDESVTRLRLIHGLAAFVLAWSQHCATDSARERLWQSMHCLRFSLALAARELTLSGRAVRHAVRTDRQNYLCSLQQDISLQDLKDPKRLYASVRKAFPSLRPSRRSNYTPLPQVRLEDGRLAVSQEERCSRWHSYFAAMEAGSTVLPEEYTAAFAMQTVLPQSRTVFDIHAVPNMREVEEVILQLPRGKASGLDGVTVELMRVHTPSTARQLLPIYLKASLSVRERVAFRGGQLMVLAKKAFAATECTQFRSILLSSVPAKTYHRVIRRASSRLVPCPG